jgi:hypothetical protein
MSETAIAPKGHRVNFANPLNALNLKDDVLVVRP